MAEKRKKADKATGVIGQKLLEGWAMLAESCSDCLVPLMKYKRDGTIKCFGCDKTFNPEKKETKGKSQSHQKTKEFPVKKEPVQTTSQKDNGIPASNTRGSLLSQNAHGTSTGSQQSRFNPKHFFKSVERH